MDKKRSLDLLSNLPLCIIHVILSLLPIRDAVRTSLLSRQWRFIWCSLPRLAFDDTHTNYGDTQRMLNFINQALLLRKGSIHEFQLRLLYTNMSAVQSQLIDHWLLFLSRNDIRILVLDIFSYSYVVHSSLYSCQYLTHLKFRAPTIPTPPPSFKGFLFLRSLDIQLDDASIFESIVAHSPLLEELKLDAPGDKLTIHALKLKYLHCSLMNLTLTTPLLEEFNGGFESTEYFSIGVESMVFHHLRTIKLSCVYYNSYEVMPAVIRLITGAPNLQKLKISGFHDKKEPGVDYFSWDTESAPDITFNSLKVIKMNGYGSETDEMKLIEFLLARSPVLETLVYEPGRISKTTSLSLTSQLLSYHWASASAELVTYEKCRRC